MGLEMFQIMKRESNPEFQRKMLLAKWMYVNGFLDDVFPSTERFIPGHVAERGIEDMDEDS